METERRLTSTPAKRRGARAAELANEQRGVNQWQQLRDRGFAEATITGLAHGGVVHRL